MIEAREMFAPVYANSLYTAELRASPHWARLARMMNLPESPPTSREARREMLELAVALFSAGRVMKSLGIRLLIGSEAGIRTR